MPSRSWENRCMSEFNKSNKPFTNLDENLFKRSEPKQWKSSRKFLFQNTQRQNLLFTYYLLVPAITKAPFPYTTYRKICESVLYPDSEYPDYQTCDQLWNLQFKPVCIYQAYITLSVILTIKAKTHVVICVPRVTIFIYHRSHGEKYNRRRACSSGVLHSMDPQLQQSTLVYRGNQSYDSPSGSAITEAAWAEPHHQQGPRAPVTAPIYIVSSPLSKGQCQWSWRWCYHRHTLDNSMHKGSKGVYDALCGTHISAVLGGDLCQLSDSRIKVWQRRIKSWRVFESVCLSYTGRTGMESIMCTVPRQYNRCIYLYCGFCKWTI